MFARRSVALSLGLPLAVAAAVALAPAVASAADDEPPPLPAPTEPATVAAPEPPVASSEPSEEKPQKPAEEKYVPHGFTMEVGLGFAFTSASSSDPSHEHANIGLAPLSLSVGGFVSPKVALMARAAGTSYFRETADDSITVDGNGHIQQGGKSYQILNGFYGGVVQVWPTERFFVGGGVGYAIFGTNPLQSVPSRYRFTETGIGFDARAGWVFAVAGKNQAFALTVDVIPSFVSNSTVVGSALNLQWQML